MTLLGESGAVVVNVLESFFRHLIICQPEGCLRTPHYMAFFAHLEQLGVAYYSTKGYGALSILHLVLLLYE